MLEVKLPGLQFEKSDHAGLRLLRIWERICERFYDLSCLGAIMIKATTKRAALRESDAARRRDCEPACLMRSACKIRV